jgi:hypothetical protein
MRRWLEPQIGLQRAPFMPNKLSSTHFRLHAADLSDLGVNTPPNLDDSQREDRQRHTRTVVDICMPELDYTKPRSTEDNALSRN